MDKFSKKDIDTLFSNICCSQCKNNFTENSIQVIENFNDIKIIKIICEKCYKDFGEAVLRTSGQKHFPLEIIEGPEPISYDDVIKAHKFIKENL